MNFYRRYPQGYLLFFHITGNSVEISCYIKVLPGGIALRRKGIMSQVTTLGAGMCQGTFF